MKLRICAVQTICETLNSLTTNISLFSERARLVKHAKLSSFLSKVAWNLTQLNLYWKITELYSLILLHKCFMYMSKTLVSTVKSHKTLQYWSWNKRETQLFRCIWKCDPFLQSHRCNSFPISALFSLFLSSSSSISFRYLRSLISRMET